MKGYDKQSKVDSIILEKKLRSLILLFLILSNC